MSNFPRASYYTPPSVGASYPPPFPSDRLPIHAKASPTTAAVALSNSRMMVGSGESKWKVGGKLALGVAAITALVLSIISIYGGNLALPSGYAITLMSFGVVALALLSYIRYKYSSDTYTSSEKIFYAVIAFVAIAAIVAGAAALATHGGANLKFNATASYATAIGSGAILALLIAFQVRKELKMRQLQLPVMQGGPSYPFPQPQPEPADRQAPHAYQTMAIPAQPAYAAAAAQPQPNFAPQPQYAAQPTYAGGPSQADGIDPVAAEPLIGGPLSYGAGALPAAGQNDAAFSVPVPNAAVDRNDQARLGAVLAREMDQHAQPMPEPQPVPVAGRGVAKPWNPPAE